MSSTKPTPFNFAAVFRAKEERRRDLAALPIDEKVRIMEQLQDMGLALREARKTLRHPLDPTSKP